ncbi:MAG: TlpA disulfide reductase family protein [Vicinamibacteria bacterium]
MMINTAVFLTLALAQLPAVTSTSSVSSEAKIVEYLKANVKAGEPVVVSKLNNEVFTSPEDRKALNRLFNTFFKIPLFVVQVQKASGKPPSLKEISEQFSFVVPGEADVILHIMDADPRMPKFIKRDPKSGEIVSVDVAMIQAHPRFGKILERTIAGWEGNPAPPFAVKTYDGADLSLASMGGKPFLLYFWFTNCPPFVKTSPLLVELDKMYGPKGFTILGMNSDRLLELDYTDADRAAYVKKLGIQFKLAHANAEAQGAYGGVSVFPTLFFVDKNGVVVKYLVNGQDKTVLEDAIKLALK